MAQQLFGDVQYVVIDLPELPFDDPGFTESIELLDSHGAQRISLDDGRIRDIRGLTHIITRSVDFPDYELAYSNFVHIVKPTWITHGIAKGKQQNPRQYNPDPRYFLNDVIVCCADIPEGDKEAIQGGVLAMGGLYSDPMTKLVTHLIALQPEDPKVLATLGRNLSCKIVLPHWFDDCLRLRRRISEQPYILPDPEFLRSNSSPPTPRNNKDIVTAISPSPEKAWEALEKATVFNNKVVMLSQDLELGKRTRRVIEGIIKSGGGKATDDWRQAGIYICKYRTENDFPSAALAGKDIGNLSWLYHLIVLSRWTNPLLRLLHYPIPKDGIPGFQDFKISVSNYTGSARQYLENLVRASGATFTKTMVQNNTHLITAHTGSEKCEAAKEWNIHIINHLWLEDSYAMNKIQSLTVPRYTHFPSRTNLGEVVGQTPIDRDTIKRFFLELAQSSSDASSSEDEADLLVVDDEPAAPATTKRVSKQHDNFMTPSVNGRFDDKENQVPDTIHGSRASKAKAMSRIHDAASDIALFNKEMKRVGGVLHGKDRVGRTSLVGTTPQLGRKSTKASPKRPASDEEDLSEDESVETSRPTKKTKRDSSNTTRIKVVVSMYDRWLNNAGLEQADKAKLRSLGIRVLDNPAPSGFILCASRIARTKKFVTALSYGPVILTTNFLDYCLQHKEVPDLEDYHLRDEEGEEKLDIELSACIKRAKANNQRLLKGWQIFCTEKIPGGFDTYKEIIEGNGGSCHLFKAKTVMSVAKNKLNGDEEGELFLISGSTTEEKKCWEPFRTMAHKAQMVPKIVKTDWLLGLAMAQEVIWNQDWLQPNK